MSGARRRLPLDETGARASTFDGGQMTTDTNTEKESNLIEHAKREMRLAGLYDADSDYGGRIPEAVLRVLRPFAEDRHSGGSAWLVTQVLERLMRYKTLTPITSDPQYWHDVSDMSGEPMWQSTRDPACFSQDGGKTFYSVDDPERTVQEAATP